MRGMKSKWFAVLAVLFAVTGAVCVMSGCDDGKSSSNRTAV